MLGINVMLNFFDNFSNSINRTISATEKAANSFDNLGNSANMVDVNSSAIDNMANSASNLSNQIDNWTSKIGNYDKSAMEAIYTTEELVQMGYKTENALNNTANAGKNIEPPLDKATKQQERFNNTINQGSSNMNGLASNVSNLLKTYLSFQAIKHGITSTIGEAMKMQQQLFTMQGIMGNTEVGTAYFNNLQKKANESVFAFEDFAQNARNYMQFTKNTDTLDKLANLSERLTLIDPTQGLQGAGFALKEMMSGDGTSLKERFGFGKADIEILKASKDMSSFLDQFDSLLNKKGFTEDMLAKYNQSASAQFDNLKSNIVTSMGQAGNGALEALNPVMTRLNQAFSNGSFQGFFSGISTGLYIISSIIGTIIDGISYVGEIIQNNWSLIGPILSFIGGTLLGAILVALWGQVTALWAAIPPLLLNVKGWMLINWPIMLAVGAIFLFIYVLTQCGITGEQICGVIGGSFMVLFGSIYNIVALAWNIFASFAEFLANLFNHPLYAISNLFANIWNSIVDFVGAAIDSIIGMIKEVPFLGDLVGDFSSQSLKLDIPEVPTDYWVAPKMEMKDLTNEFNYGYGKGANFANGIGNLANNLNGLGTNGLGVDLDSWNKAQGPGNLAFGNDDKKNLKNINDKIDISNEHLEMLTDLASEKSISNFVTLTPTVQVTTGDIRQEADINKIISSIETYMENELQNSAEGLYE